MGSLNPVDQIDPQYDYWRLIGLDGVVLTDEKKKHPFYPNLGNRVLVAFQISLAEMGLLSHNKTPNSLWIHILDLRELDCL